jgi:hypothetical protein
MLARLHEQRGCANMSSMGEPAGFGSRLSPGHTVGATIARPGVFV